MMDFSGNAGAATAFDTIPNGQLAWATLNVKGVKDSTSGGKYLDVELTLEQGQPYGGRKVFDRIGDPNHPGNSDKYKQMGSIAITRILECGRGAGPNNPEGYKITSYADLTGLRVAVKLKIEEGTDGHDDKNRVGEWLTPNPQSQSGHKFYQKLVAGEHNASAQPAAAASNGFGGAQPSASQPGFGGQAPGFQQPPTGGNPSQSGGEQPQAASGSTTTTFPSNDPGATPGWLGQAPAQ